MTQSSGRAEIESLLAERGRFETWLDQLSAKASTMPAHVVERVRADYQQRLDKVVADLQSKADSMRSDASALEERVRVLEAELSAKRDARAEDELRALVGEYDEGAWEKKSADHDAGINALESERVERETEHLRVKQLLAEAGRPGRSPTPVASPVIAEVAPAAATHTIAEPTPAVIASPAPVEEPVAAAPAPEADAPPAAPAQPAENPGPPQGKRPSPFDEIGFMRAVVGRATPYAGTEPLREEDLMPRAPTPARSPAQPRTQTPAAETRAVPQETPASAAPRETPVRDSGDRKAVPTFEAPPIPDAPIVAPVRSSSPAMPMIENEASLADALRASTTMPDAARSLKCQECGWMNYPTEWYCEKCGGELAAF